MRVVSQRHPCPSYILPYDMWYSENQCVSAPSCNTDEIQFHAGVTVLRDLPDHFRIVSIPWQELNGSCNSHIHGKSGRGASSKRWSPNNLIQNAEDVGRSPNYRILAMIDEQGGPNLNDRSSLLASRSVFCGVKATGFLFKSYFVRLELHFPFCIPPLITFAYNSSKRS